MSLLTAHKWRGEVRELENIIERAVIFSRGESITIDALPDSFAGTAPAGMPAGGTSLEDALGLMTKNFISEVLKRHGYDKEKTAAELGISLPTLYRRIKELGIPGDPAKDA
jgi:transcriptional regulator with PAS, ATPase and Fis domain